MSKRMLINATHPDEIRVAITDNGQLIDLDIESPGQEQKKANIYKGTISSIEPSLGAVFVNYGSERHGFLPLKEISSEYFLTQDPTQLESPDIRTVLREGQPLVVQIEKEERGTKGAALTTFISLAGSFLVLMPNNPKAGGISRRIEGEDRDQLRDAVSQLTVPEGMGVIIRTAGVGRSSEELQWDLQVLLRYWDAIKQAATLKEAPYLIHQESDVIIRAIRDYLRQDMAEILIDEPTAQERAVRYLELVRPDFIQRVKYYEEHTPLFARYHIEQQIEAAYQREVRLPSGGSIVIDQSEALIAIDINSARATKGSNIEETALNTNLEAADEIARQLRIRDMGGLIVIDFIDMTPVKNQREVENRLREALQNDRARTQMGRISRFGLLEMSRQRIRSPLVGGSHVTCPRCDGQGKIRGIESLALSVLHAIQEHAARTRFMHFQLYAPLDLATYLINEKRATLSAYEDQWHAKISIVPCSHLESPHYQLKHTRHEADSFQQLSQLASYKLIPALNNEVTILRAATKATDEPVITQFLGGEAPPPRGHRRSNGLIRRLWQRMFGQGRTSPEMPLEPQRQEKRSPHANRNRRRNFTRTPREDMPEIPTTAEESGNKAQASTRETRPEHRNRSRRHRYRRRNEGSSSQGQSGAAPHTGEKSPPAKTDNSSSE